MRRIFSDRHSRADNCAGVSSATIRPRSIMTTRSQIAVASERIWVLRIRVCEPAKPRMTSRISIICLGSRPAVGSSRIKTGGS